MASGWQEGKESRQTASERNTFPFYTRPAVMSSGMSAVFFASQRQLKKKKDHFRELTFQKEHLSCHLPALSGN
jgi:hypothetical protein